VTVQFGWMLPTGNQRMPTAKGYLAHIESVLKLIGRRFHSYWIPDHLMDDIYPIPEALTTLAYLAAAHPSLHFGTCVLSQSFRNPAYLAKAAATLQNLSGGRFILGIGAGWKVDEYNAYGYDFPSAAIRISQMSEAVQICRQLWAAGDKHITFRGEHYTLHEATCLPMPQPPPPLIIGGTGERLTLKAVAEYADWWNIPGAPPDVLRHKADVLAQHCAALSREPSTIRRTWMGVVAIGRTEQIARNKLDRFSLWEGDRALMGTPAMIREQIEEYVALGITLFILSFVDEPLSDGIEMFLGEVAGSI